MKTRHNSRVLPLLLLALVICSSFFLGRSSGFFACTQNESLAPIGARLLTPRDPLEGLSSQELQDLATEATLRFRHLQTLAYSEILGNQTTKAWGPSDPNAGFLSNRSLPLLAVVSISAGQESGKASWQHRMSLNSKLKYCQRWGYDLIIDDHPFVGGREPAWGKIPLMLRYLKRYQWLLWMDMDSLFMDFSRPIHELLNNNWDVIIAKDWNGINTGVFFLRNSPYSHAMLQQLWKVPRRHWQPYKEQSALMALLDQDKRQLDANLHQQHTLFLPQREMNSYGDEFAYGNVNSKYHDGDRIIHFPNCGGDRRLGDESTCQKTMEKFYNHMLRQAGIPDVNASEVPPNIYYSSSNYQYASNGTDVMSISEVANLLK